MNNLKQVLNAPVSGANSNMAALEGEIAKRCQVDIQSQLAKQFSHQAHCYDEYATVQKLIAHDLLATLESVPGTLLDIGCGTGSVTSALNDFAHHVVGADLSMGMLEHAKGIQRTQSQTAALNDEERLSWVCGDAHALPFQTAVFDGVFSSMALQWCMPIERALSEIVRVLKPQGQGWLALMSNGSFSELDACWSKVCGKSKVNAFISAQRLMQLAEGELAANFSVSFRTYTTWHPNLSSLLKSITRVGAGLSISTPNQPALTKTQFKQIEQVYMADFGQENGLPLTYQVAFIQVHK